jgi:hypothetical protein
MKIDNATSAIENNPKACIKIPPYPFDFINIGGGNRQRQFLKFRFPQQVRARPPIQPSGEFAPTPMKIAEIPYRAG